MSKPITFLAAAALVFGTASAFAQGKSADVQKATPATPATRATPATPAEPAKAQAQKQAPATSGDGAKKTKTQKRPGEPKGEAKGQTK